MLTPIKRREWDAVKAAHLLNRAGFGGTPTDVERLAAMAPEQAVASLVEFDRSQEHAVPPDWAARPGSDLRPQLKDVRALPEPERRKRIEALRDEQREQMQVLRVWWLKRMRQTPCPLREKLTLFWHGHFASGVRKVRSAYAMYRQNQTFRRLAADNWRTLVLEASREPAMLIYLDNAQSRASAPNENFARELMELFTLGEGNYQEKDIQESARAFTGWTLERDRLAFCARPAMHDNGLKTFMGREGKFDGADIIETILAQPRAADFISRKLWSFFAYDEPSPALVQALGAELRRQDYDLRPLLATMFVSAEFYGAKALRTQIKSPVQWFIGTLKACELDVPPGPVGPAILRRLGQDLFEPPNVKGWDGGTAWINAASLVSRCNGTALLLGGSQGLDGLGAGGMGKRALPGLEGKRVLPPERRGSREEAQQYLQRRIFMAPLRGEDEAAVRQVVAAMPEPRGWTDAQVRELVRFMMSTPPYQLT